MEALRFSDYCANCRRSLAEIEKILFVEKEVGRCFCCEECIQEYFQPTVEAMEEEYLKLRSESDFKRSDLARFNHYRGLTLEDPDEVWVNQLETGERHFTFVSHFRNGEERVSYVVICLAIDGAPSFIFLGFATRDEDLVDEYRRGIDLRVTESEPEEPQELAEVEPVAEPGKVHQLYREQEHREPNYFERLHTELRQAGDIPRELFERFEGFVEPTLDDPDEIWRFSDEDGNSWLTFIARHALEDDEDGESEIDEFVMIAVCRPTVIEDHGGHARRGFEVVFAFPTIDPGLVQHFRKGINSLNKAFGVGWARGRAA